MAENILALTKSSEEALIELPANEKAEGSNQIQALKKNGAELLTSLKTVLSSGASVRTSYHLHAMTRINHK